MFGGAEVPGDATKNLEGGVSFRFNFSVEGENGPSGQGVEEEKREEEDELGHRLASSEAAAATTPTPWAPAFEVFPDPVDVNSLQVRLRWSQKTLDVRIGSIKEGKKARRHLAMSRIEC